MSLLTLRGKVVQGQWERRRCPERLWCPGSFNCCLLFLLPPQLASPSPPVPLEVMLNPSCTLTKRALLSEKSILVPPWDVDQPLSQLCGVRLLNRLPPGPAPRAYSPGTGVQLGPWVPELRQRCGGLPSKVPMWGAAWRGSPFTVKLSLPASVSPRCRWLALACSPLPLSGLFWPHQELGGLWLRAV